MTGRASWHQARIDSVVLPQLLADLFPMIEAAQSRVIIYSRCTRTLCWCNLYWHDGLPLNLCWLDEYLTAH